MTEPSRDGSVDPHRHTHSHGVVDPSLLDTRKGIRAVKWSFAGLFATAAFQVLVVFLSGSVALLADTIHNFADAATAVPLWIAFRLARRSPNERFTYGYGRVEDLAGMAIVCTILFSAGVAGWESLQRFWTTEPVRHLWAVAAASLIGFAGNEAVARYRMRVGEEIGSAALVADGHHARVDGLTSLAVLGGAVGVWLGYPVADPVVGLLITAAILRIVWESARSVFTRLLDGVDPDIVEEIRHAAAHVPGVEGIAEVRARWLGHRLHAELNVSVQPDLSVEKGHRIAKDVRHGILHALRYLSGVTIHIDPADAAGEDHHRVEGHEHDGLPGHSH